MNTESGLSEKEIAERRDAALKRALATPHKPHTKPAPQKRRPLKSRGRAKP